jgi:putative ABC transport system ATP-binding protein
MIADSVQYRLQEVSKVYHLDGVDVQALRDVDLTIDRGEFVVLLGPSGSGKSTLLNLLGGLDRPTAGTVCYGNDDLSKADDRLLTRFRRKKLGFIFQSYNLASSLTAIENVRLATDLVSDPIPAADALALVGMQDRVDHFPSQLSGGEQQRVAIARAIAKRPEVLLCDEPTGALDIDTGIRVLDVIQEIHREFRPTIVIITHNAVIGKIANRICYMSDGHIKGIERNQQLLSASNDRGMWRSQSDHLDELDRYSQVSDGRLLRILKVSGFVRPYGLDTHFAV